MTENTSLNSDFITQSRRPGGMEAMEKELEIGRLIQASFLPRTLPQLDGWELAAHFQAAREVAGDFFDAFFLANGKRLGLVIADVCDKGVPAAMFMALFRSLIRAFSDQNYSLGWMDVLASDQQTPQGNLGVGRRRQLLSPGTTALKNAIDLTNNYIAKNHGDTNMFATMFFGVLNPVNGSLSYINGGHEAPFLVSAGGIQRRLEPTGPAVGLMAGLEFNLDQVELAPGEMLLAYTDGVTDLRNSDGQSFTEERLAELVNEPVDSGGKLVNRIRTELDVFRGRQDQFDDITLLALRRQPSG